MTVCMNYVEEQKNVGSELFKLRSEQFQIVGMII